MGIDSYTTPEHFPLSERPSIPSCLTTVSITLSISWVIFLLQGRVSTVILFVPLLTWGLQLRRTIALPAVPGKQDNKLPQTLLLAVETKYAEETVKIYTWTTLYFGSSDFLHNYYNWPSLVDQVNFHVHKRKLLTLIHGLIWKKRKSSKEIKKLKHGH